MKIYILTEIETNGCDVSNYVFTTIEEVKAHFCYVLSECYADESNADMENLIYSEEGFRMFVTEYDLQI